MNIKTLLIACRSLPFHSLGGMEIITWDLAKAFVQKGIRVTVLTTACSNLAEHSELDGVSIHCLPVPSGKYSASWWELSKHTFVTKYLGNVDAVLSVSAAGMSMAKASRLFGGPPFFVQAHGTAWGEFLSKMRQMKPKPMVTSVKNLVSMLEDVGYRNFDKFIAVGEGVKQQLKTLPTNKIIGNIPVVVIANGVDETYFAFDLVKRQKIRKDLGISPDDSVIVSASRLHAQKGIYEGLKAFAVAKKTLPSLHYLIAGSGPDENRLKEKVLELDLQKWVHFLGAVPRSEIPGIFSAADVFLFTTKRVEGLPMNMLEALACGLPSIVSNSISGGFRNVSIVDPMNTTDVAYALLTELKSNNRENKLSKDFSLDACSDKYLHELDLLQ